MSFLLRRLFRNPNLPPLAHPLWISPSLSVALRLAIKTSMFRALKFQARGYTTGLARARDDGGGTEGAFTSKFYDGKARIWVAASQADSYMKRHSWGTNRL
ncbi:hypothetical protein BGW36DRAFT_363190 [Talaromyces proteolyticus]|uniref:Uncharacterized protein n=1 Tax=Talaromyces proteolyticus TaxID=1131652 RepID=A0AAD4PSW8_9EURO|nr:uncharacterized protein BGW36DRAFT_363190 [Talaromyces proteolyticus]KAH8692186.1 hypothetical protein BGW36DRAFT_363190 [Talaromyces proteolyticus]